METETLGLDPELFDRWVAALRSGEYEQATGQLRDLDDTGAGYCCLGVLCDIAGVDLDAPNPDDMDSLVGEQGGVASSRAPGLPAPLRLLPQRLRSELADANDGGQSFTGIADHLEAHRDEYVRQS